MFYGIDLEVDDLDCVRFLSLAYRVAAYDGVVARRVQIEQAAAEQPVAVAQSARAVGESPAADTGAVGLDPHTRAGLLAYHAEKGRSADQVNVVSLDAFRAQFPGLIG